MTESEYKRRCQNMSSNKKQIYDNLSNEEKYKRHKRMSMSHRGKWKQHSLQKQQKIIEKIKNVWNSKSENEKQNIISKRAKTLKSRTDEQKKITQNKRSKTITSKSEYKKQQTFIKMSNSIKQAWKNKTQAELNQFKSKIANSRKNRKYMYNDNLQKCISVKPEEITKYLALGYILGRKIYKK